MVRVCSLSSGVDIHYYVYIQPNSDMMNVCLLYKPRHDMRVFIELSHSSIGSQLFIII